MEVRSVSYTSDGQECNRVEEVVLQSLIPKTVSFPVGRRTFRHKTRNRARRIKDWATFHLPWPGKKMEMTKKDLIKTYRLHVFVFLMFLATVLSVGVSWYFRILFQSTQIIHFDPRSRKITLTDPTLSVGIEGNLGRDTPQWQKPLVNDENLYDMRYKWKNTAILQIKHFGNEFVQCHNISWQSLHPQHVPHDCFNIKRSAWYGPSNQSESIFPIQGRFTYIPTNQRLDNNGMFRYVDDFYWLSSTGVALRINGHDPIHLYWNETGYDGKHKLCIISNHTGPLYQQGMRSNLTYTLCCGKNLNRTRSFMHAVFPPSSDVSFPPDDVFRGYFWSFRKYSATTKNISQDNVINLAKELKNHSLTDAKIVIDSKWQHNHGDLTFNSELFPNISHMISTLEEFGCNLTILLSPNIHHKSKNFEQGIDKSTFVHDASGEVAGLVRSSEGVSAVVDISNNGAKEWYRNQLKDLMKQLPNTSLRLTYGTGTWMPYKPQFRTEGGSPTEHKTRMTETMSQISKNNYLVVEHTSDTRHISQLIPIHTIVTQSPNSICMSGAIESALTLGLMGYPFVMLDGLELDMSTPMHRNGSERELYIRWIQLAAFFPAAQISILPWNFDSEVVSIAKNFSTLHHDVILPILQNEVLRNQVAQGVPILRPVWWSDPGDRAVHDMEIQDEFLIGDRHLLAAILCSGVRTRDIYFPSGVWEDVINPGEVIPGPILLRKYHVPLNGVAFFERRKQVDPKF